MKNFKKYAETLVETVILLAIVAAAVALALVLSGHGEVIQDKNIIRVLWALVAGIVLYAGYKIYTMKLNQK